MQGRLQIDVFAAGKGAVKAGGIIENGDLAVHLYASGTWPQIAGDHLEQCRFSAAVDADDAPALALLDLERDVLQSGKSLVDAADLVLDHAGRGSRRASAPQRTENGQLQARRGRRPQPEIFRNILDADRHAVVAARRGYWLVCSHFGHSTSAKACLDLMKNQYPETPTTSDTTKRIAIAAGSGIFP